MTLAETRAEKYDADQLKDLQAKGHTFPGGTSYPIDDVEDLKAAIQAVGRGNADHDAIRKYVMARAEDLKQSELIPENWGADGSLIEEKAATAGVECPTCNGKGTILEGNRDCPDCDGTGKVAEAEQKSQRPGRVKPRARNRRAGPPLGREYRRFAAEGLEVRSASDSDSIVISGMPIVYNTAYAVRDMFGTFEETMLPGVANDVLARNADVRFLFNHDGLPLARTLSGTLTLDTTSTRGLPMTASLDARQQLANDLAVAIERGDVNQMSCGFCVATDEWNDAGDERSISKFSDLFDVSAVTYPASPTTSLELAYRSILSKPPESQARVRQLWVAVGKDFREGKRLSAESTGHLQNALDALGTADSVDIPGVMGNLQTLSDAIAGGKAHVTNLLEGTGGTDEDGTEGDALGTQSDALDGTRSKWPAPSTSDERRAEMERRTAGSYNDIQSALSTALQGKFGGTDDDGWCDLWVQDAGDDWVVWNAYGDAKPGPGLWKLTYSIDADMNVTFTGDPAQVAIETSYVPVARSVDPSLAALELEAEQLRLRGQRRHAA